MGRLRSLWWLWSPAIDVLSYSEYPKYVPNLSEKISWLCRLVLLVIVLQALSNHWHEQRQP